MEKKNYTYILKCADGTLYCGWTNDLEKRLKSHNDGKGAKYTRSRLPVSLVYFQEFDTAQEAQKREYSIKQMTRQEKLKLIEKHQKTDTGS
ncbi:MAG: GIY-YIG nuclease family protein [Clostridia bacterium]|nr:GIY-YIG nuclease family protein [Clostridia bacterium]